MDQHDEGCSLARPAPPALIVVTGPPASGKTTLARLIAGHFSLPLMTKDTIKEALYDTLDTSDVAWSQRLGRASMVLLLHFAEAHLAAGQPCVVEANYLPEYGNPELQALQQRHPFLPIQVLCRADYAVLLERYRQRNESGERHPGHLDQARVGEFSEDRVRAHSEPLAIGGHLIVLDTTRFEAVDYEALFARIADCLLMR